MNNRYYYYFFILVLVILVVKIVAIIYSIYRKNRDRRILKSVTTPNRGTKSERELVINLIKFGLPCNTIFHDLYVQKRNGEFSQIDLVAITAVGIIVFEVKEYSGWIFGNGNQSQWTEVLAYGKQKYRFYNPIMQNSRHISELKILLKQSDTMPFYSVVVFYGNCTLKDVCFVPKGTYLIKPNRLSDVISDILSNHQPTTYSSKVEVEKALREAVWNGEDITIQRQHIQNIRNMLGKDRVYD